MPQKEPARIDSTASCSDGSGPSKGPISRSKHILVAEDDETVRNWLRIALEHEGFVVHAAENGRAAADYARSGPVDLVITDLWMPTMNGVELIEALNAMDCRAEMVVLSAHLTTASTDKLRGLGVLRMLNKPMDTATLQSAVREGLESDRRKRLAYGGIIEARAAEPPGQEETAAQPIILVADDDEGVRELLREALSRSGYHVEEACDGEQAVEKALAYNIDLVLMDLNMPRMSGRQAVEVLRRASRDCFVVCITGECDQQEIDAALRAGAVKCFRKPFDVAALLSEIKRLDLMAAHRKRRAEWERTCMESFARRNRSNRYGRRFKWVVAAAVAIVAISAAAVPIVTGWIRSAARATEKIGDALNSAGRIEGYLQRDEARELRPGPR